jgi:threonine dehydratase
MEMRRQEGKTGEMISATRGNHGQSLPFAAARHGFKVTIVVPKGNSVEKNAAMKALGANLIEHGEDFNAALDHAQKLAQERNLDMISSFSRELVAGVASYGAELFEVAGELDALFVPIGMGSGICSLIVMRDILGLKTRIYGVVAQKANAYKLSFDKGEPVSTKSADTLADGMAVRIPHEQALENILKGAENIIEVSDEEIAQAIRIFFTDTHNIAEGAGAAALAALVQMRTELQGKRAGVILSGGNIDRSLYRRILVPGDEKI